MTPAEGTAFAQDLKLSHYATLHPPPVQLARLLQVSVEEVGVREHPNICQCQRSQKDAPI